MIFLKIKKVKIKTYLQQIIEWKIKYQANMSTEVKQI